MSTTTPRPVPRTAPAAQAQQEPPAPVLDMGTYARTTCRVRVDDLDLDRFREHPLPADVLHSVHLLSELETHSILFLRDLLVTPSHADAEVSAFLTMWNYEEYGHGLALDAVLRAHDLDPRDGEERLRAGWRSRLAPVRRSLLANAVGEDFVALHLTWCLVAERVSEAAYVSLAARSGDPVLTEVLTRIAAQERRQGDWCAAQARIRLAQSRSAQRVTRAVMRTSFSAPGAGVLAPADTRHLARHLFGDAAGLATARRIDAEVDALPGLAGLRVVERARVKSLGWRSLR